MLSACVSWDPYQLSPGSAEQLPDRLKLRLESGADVTLRSPYLEGDSVVAGRSGGAELQRVPLSAVVSLESGKGPNVGAAVGILGLTVGLIYVASELLPDCWAAVCSDAGLITLPAGFLGRPPGRAP